MEENIKLKRLGFNEEKQVIDLIYSDEELKNTFNRERGIISRLINSCYVAMIEYQNEEIGFVMIVNNQITSKNEIDMGVLKKYRGHGYGTKALGQLKDIIINNDLKVEIQTKINNLAAIKSIVTNGFFLVREDKEYRYYSLPKEEYENKRLIK
jgi:RimJ/RimL family protein N-acetyltransferase